MLHRDPSRRDSRNPFRKIASLAFLLAFTSLPASAQINGVMMQYFHWYLDCSGTHWLDVADQADELAAVGITALWLPPATKGASGCDVGYGIYDLYDLGEFDQKGSVRTKYGYDTEFLAAVQAARAQGIDIYFDVVLNHKGGADTTEPTLAVRVDSNNRNNEYGSDILIDTWTVFDFPGRGNTYSSFKWRNYHFDGTDWAQNLQESNTVYKFRGVGKAWDWEVSTEFGNYDYLLYADIDFSHPDVRTELKSWGEWVVHHAGVEGFRLDAVKHIEFTWWNEWLDHVRTQTGKPLFTVAEYWSYNVGELHNWITETGGRAHLFDAPLHLNFHLASKGGGGYDMRNLMSGTLMEQQPALAVTLVENHDTQPLQALASPVQDWFKPLAYAFILLREEGYPNVFYADYYGASYFDQGQQIDMASHKAILDILLRARRDYAYGTQRSYLDHWDIIGWTREGTVAHPESMAVLITDGPGGGKWMETGKANATYVDITGHRSDTVTTNGAGWGDFQVNGGSVSVWVATATSSPVSAHFYCHNGTTVWGQNVYAVGSIPELGSWDPANAVLLSPNAYPTWDGVVSNLPADTAVEWKCIKKHNGQVEWQQGANNAFTTPSSGSVNTSGSF
ncbi:MAG: alpha-amylase [Holophagales bacterium]|nr:alpha-amylase [Holophagales bacterium]